MAQHHCNSQLGDVDALNPSTHGTNAVLLHAAPADVLLQACCISAGVVVGRDAELWLDLSPDMASSEPHLL